MYHVLVVVPFSISLIFTTKKGAFAEGFKANR